MEHKWAIKSEKITTFFRRQGWKCTLALDSITLISIFESRRTPKHLKSLAKYLPHIRHGYIIIAELAPNMMIDRKNISETPSISPKHEIKLTEPCLQ
jgi:hypothetical protein